MLEVFASRFAGPAEVALVVDQHWRGRGFGTLLLTAAVQWARSTEIGSFRLIFSRHNWPMRQLVRKANANFDVLLGEICADIAIPPIDAGG